jgi:CDP-diglyceride synthetase
MWIPICGGWVLSIVASIIGARMGKRKAISDNL